MLKAGFSRLDVTPPLGSFISGYFIKRYAKGVLEPILLNALALSDGNTTSIIIAADLLGIRKNYCDEILSLISERTKVPTDNITICCLHQHTSIALRDTANNNVMKDKCYLEYLYRKFIDASVMAINDLTEAKISTAEAETSEKISFIRRYIMKDGRVETNPHGKNDKILKPYYDADNTVRLIRFKRHGARDIALVNFSTHADVVHGEYFSSDWPGFTRSFVENDLENVSCIMTVGCEGDSNHANFTLDEYKDGYEHARHMGRIVADAVVGMWDNTEDDTPTDILCRKELLFNKTRTDGEERYEECVKLLADPNNNTADGSKIELLGNASRIVGLRNQPIYQKLPMSSICFGRIGIIGFGGEPFTRYAVRIREKLPDRFIITLACANGMEGYLPIKEAFREGGYEAGASPFSPSLEDDCTKVAVKLLNKNG